MSFKLESNASQFLNLFRQFEDLARTRLGREDENMSEIIRTAPELRRYRMELDTCREVRNILSHKSQIQGKYVVQPSNELIALLKRVISMLEHPKTVMNIGVKRSDVCYVEESDAIWPILRKMSEESFSVIPVMSGNKVIGAFTENTLLNALLRDGIIGPNSTATFADIKDLTPLGARKKEVFKFVRQATLASEIRAMFQDVLLEKKFLAMVFVTAHGRPDEDLLRIITSRDLPQID